MFPAFKSQALSKAVARAQLAASVTASSSREVGQETTDLKRQLAKVCVLVGFGGNRAWEGGEERLTLLRCGGAP